MPPRKDDTSSVATFADHEVITPPNELRRAAIAGAAEDGDPVARAEAALKELASEFPAWMHAECERLEAARLDLHHRGVAAKSLDELFRAIHDIKGEAATFGYPAVAAAADSLCRLIEHAPDMARIPLALIDQHVDAVRAIVREHARSDLAPVALALTRRLREVTDEFLRRENSDRPDYLETIFAPPLAPAAKA